MSVINTIFGCVMGILFLIYMFNIIVGTVGGLLGIAVSLLQLIILLPWIVLEKITGIEPPDWVVKLVDAIGWLIPTKWIK